MNQILINKWIESYVYPNGPFLSKKSINKCFSRFYVALKTQIWSSSLSKMDVTCLP